MAETLRHAAGYNWYEVHEVLGREPSVDLGLRFGSSELGAAVDFAFDYLERRDPAREGVVDALEIVRTDASGSETVWSYRHAPSEAASHDLVGLWGFDVGRGWSSPYRKPVRPTPARNY